MAECVGDRKRVREGWVEADWIKYMIAEHMCPLLAGSARRSRDRNEEPTRGKGEPRTRAL